MHRSAVARSRPSTVGNGNVETGSGRQCTVEAFGLAVSLGAVSSREHMADARHSADGLEEFCRKLGSVIREQSVGHAVGVYRGA